MELKVKSEYSGGFTLEFDQGSRRAFINGKELLPVESQCMRNHSPDGFNWGYGGSGPSQLALAVLLEVTGNTMMCFYYYQKFKWDFIAKKYRGPVRIDLEDWFLVKESEGGI